MGFFVPRHKSRVDSMFPPTQISITTLTGSYNTYNPFPDQLSRFLTYLQTKPHKIRKSISYLLFRFEKFYFKTLDYMLVSFSFILDHVLLHLV